MVSFLCRVGDNSKRFTGQWACTQWEVVVAPSCTLGEVENIRETQRGDERSGEVHEAEEWGWTTTVWKRKGRGLGLLHLLVLGLLTISYTLEIISYKEDKMCFYSLWKWILFFTVQDRLAGSIWYKETAYISSNMTLWSIWSTSSFSFFLLIKKKLMLQAQRLLDEASKQAQTHAAMQCKQRDQQKEMIKKHEVIHSFSCVFGRKREGCSLCSILQ